ncbi:MAG TPA: hypothetical protein PLX89_10485 [Verrucomicrobiota bacterium]|nr:hypothetical protein [Verrucomicrobiales bacterium]HRI13424.1 hypothetical protein [Verrucomicrobiota bacterium]
MPIRIVACIVAITFMLLMSASVSALWKVWKGDRGWRWPLLALISGVIAIAAVSGRTPLGSFPEVAYRWSDNHSQITLRTGWCFYLPLAIAALALFIRVRRRNSTTTDA